MVVVVVAQDEDILSKERNKDEDQEQDKVAVRVILEGRVQNVGFRSWMKKKALYYNIKGWVRNRQNGTIEAFYVGYEDDVKDMVKLTYHGPAFAYVKRLKTFPQKDIPNLAPGFIQLPTI